MNHDNIAAIFAPCLMRTPYDDLTETLVAAEKEKRVCIHLFHF